MFAVAAPFVGARPWQYSFTARPLWPAPCGKGECISRGKCCNPRVLRLVVLHGTCTDCVMAAAQKPIGCRVERLHGDWRLARAPCGLYSPLMGRQLGLVACLPCLSLQGCAFVPPCFQSDTKGGDTAQARQPHFQQQLARVQPRPAGPYPYCKRLWGPLPPPLHDPRHDVAAPRKQAKCHAHNKRAHGAEMRPMGAPCTLG